MIDGQGMRLIEPLRELFKDEVRQLGRELGIAHELVMRVCFSFVFFFLSLGFFDLWNYTWILTKSKHPFPGPGIAIR